MTSLIAILAALLVTVFIARAVRLQIRVGGGVSIRDLRQFCAEFHQRLSEHMRANYSGDPAQLEGALRSFLPLAREMAVRQPRPVDDDLLRMLIMTSLASQRLARRREAEAAVDAVFRVERHAA